MAITFYEAVTDDGGAIGDEISSGIVDEVFRKVLLQDQVDGATIHRKVYLKNNDTVDVPITITLSDSSPFTAAIFLSSGDAQVVGDLTGLETNDSPIATTITASSHISFWIRLTVPPLSAEPDNYGEIEIEIAY